MAKKNYCKSLVPSEMSRIIAILSAYGFKPITRAGDFGEPTLHRPVSRISFSFVRTEAAILI
jgi:hypothetical protein